MSNLLVYSASAGSGKTHEITKSYISMLYTNNKAYRNILAISFTNKACEEMKIRIIDELHKLTLGKSSISVELPPNLKSKSTGDIKKITEQIFTDILHDYNAFSILTIDSFFQTILRNFTYELGINYNYEIELDTSKVINATIESLLESSKTNSELKANIISLVSQNIDNQNKWDFRGGLKTFLSNIIDSDFRNYEKNYRDFFSDKNELNSFLILLQNNINDFESYLKDIKVKIQDCLKTHNLEIKDFKGGEQRSLVKKYINTSVEIEKSDFDIVNYFNFKINAWLTSSNITSPTHIAASKAIIDICKELENYLKSNLHNYISSKIIKKNIYYAQLIDSSLDEMHKYLDSENKFLISETPIFLSQISKNNDSSFIYEKTGSYFTSYLIDEFQDTSRVQWDSLRPLLSESLANVGSNKKNIIVGDLKQAIYSWRGGDWRILSETLQIEFPHYYNAKTLVDNWRSGQNIVEFNNLFFDYAQQLITNDLKSKFPEHLHSTTVYLIQNKIYSNIKQNTKRDFDSIVNIDIFNKSCSKNDELILTKLIHDIEDLQRKKFKAGDIMILVRNNSEGISIANFIIKYAQSASADPNINYNIISSDSLLISANNAIKIIIACLKYLSDNENLIAHSEIAYFYKIENDNNNLQVIFDQQAQIDSISDKLLLLQDIFKQKLLHEIIDIIIDTFTLNKEPRNIPFLNSFRDIIHEYTVNNSADIDNFIEFWTENEDKLNLKLSENQDAINIITIHKAKGLASECVFIPFCNWDLYKNNNIIWAKTNNQEFNYLPVWAINETNKLRNSYFSNEYYQSQFKQIIESFNILYVAFTRAKKALFIYSEHQTDNMFKKVSSIIFNTMQGISKDNQSGNKYNITTNQIQDCEYQSYTIGKLIANKDETKTKNEYVKSYPVFTNTKTIKVKQSLKSINDIETSSPRDKGLILHKLFENIISYKDISKAVLKLQTNGIIQICENESYIQQLTSLLNIEFVKKWYDNTSYKIYNEIEIINTDNTIKRPDRLMENDNEIIILDYKFGKTIDPKHINQILNYKNLLSNLTTKTINSYLWYITESCIVEIDNNIHEYKTIKL